MSFEAYYRKEIQKYGGVKKYIFAKAREKKPLLDRIRKYSKNRKILEAGSGSASNSIFLANIGYGVTSLDKDKDMLEFSKNISKNFSRSPKFVCGDINKFSLHGFSVVFSHGVLEHFSDKEIINLINKELGLGEYVIFSVPSNFFKQEQAINGDERFMSPLKWRSLISKTRGKLVEEFSYFYDPDNLKLKLLKLLFNLTFGKLPIKKPYIGFVVKNGR